MQHRRTTYPARLWKRFMMVSYTESACCIWFKPGGFLQGGTVMRQAAFIQGDLGWRPVSAFRPCPWWTCSHGEVIHDVSSVSCRWRTDRGPKKEHEFVFSSLLLHMFALKPEHRKQLFKKKKKRVLLLLGLLCDLRFIQLLGVSDKSKLIAAGPKCDVLFFLGILKWRWCLIHFWFISTLLTETGNLLQWNMELSAKAAKNLDTTIRWKRNVVRFWAVVLFQLCDYSLFQLNNAPVTKAGPIKNNNKKTLA